MARGHLHFHTREHSSSDVSDVSEVRVSPALGERLSIKLKSDMR